MNEDESIMPENYVHSLTPFFSPLNGYHPVITPLQDAITHLRQAVENPAAVNKIKLRGEIANIKHWLAFLEARAKE